MRVAQHGGGQELGVAVHQGLGVQPATGVVQVYVVAGVEAAELRPAEFGEHGRRVGLGRDGGPGAGFLLVNQELHPFVC